MQPTRQPHPRAQPSQHRPARQQRLGREQAPAAVEQRQRDRPAVLLGHQQDPLLCGAVPAGARTLDVGPDKALKQPSEAAVVAADGDRIVIAPGEYFDCAVWHASKLVIEGGGKPEDTVITDKTCRGKGLFLTDGEDITIRNLTLTRARVPDGNGACGGACAHGIYAGNLDLLRVERSKFFETRQAHHIKSRARRTEVIDSDLQDGPNGTSSYQIEVPSGGTVVVRGCTIQKGPQAGNHSGAIVIGMEGVTHAAPGDHRREQQFPGRWDVFLVPGGQRDGHRGDADGQPAGRVGEGTARG